MLLIVLLLLSTVSQPALSAVPQVQCTQPSDKCANGCNECSQKGLQCLLCGCEALCLPTGAEPQTPLWKCDDGSPALQCIAHESDAACRGANCRSGACKVYKCGNTCSPICDGQSTAVLDKIQEEGVPQKMTVSRKLTIINNSVKEGDVMCPDGITPAVPCTDPSASPDCSTIDCPKDASITYECKMFTCPEVRSKGTECIPICVDTGFQATPGKCPADYPEVQCPFKPVCKMMCTIGKECAINTCGNCTATCKPSEGQCVDHLPPVNCFKDPCMHRNCTAGRMCVSEYCGGCYAGCVLKKPCTTGKTRRACLGTANGCMVARCGGGATCVPDQCRDCAAKCVGPCKPGYFVNRDTASCVKCPLGFACAGGNETTTTAEPEPCNGGFYSDERGLTECKPCEPGTSTPDKPKKKGYTKCRPVTP